MIELVKLSKKERIGISVECESFFLVSKELGKFKSVFDTIKTITGNGYRKEIWCFICACTKALRYGNTGSQLPLSPKYYHTANKIHGQKLSPTKMKRLISMLEEEQLITMYKGFKLKNQSMMSCFIMSDTLIGMIDVGLVEKYGIIRSPDEYVEVKNYKEGVVITDYKNIRGVRAVKKDMARINNNLVSHDIRIEGKKSNIVYKRVFADNITKAGRFYTTNGFMNYDKHLRETITINGEDTVEIDLANLHPRLYMTLEGIEVSDDWCPYTLPQSKFLGLSKEDLRMLGKVGMMCILYGDDQGSATKALSYEVSQQKGNKIKRGVYSKVIDHLVEYNKEIAHRFFQQDGWQVLQAIDSKLVAKVMIGFTELGEVCLPWHDSFVVTKSNKELLVSQMKNAWEEVLGTVMNFKFKIN